MFQKHAECIWYVRPLHVCSRYSTCMNPALTSEKYCHNWCPTIVTYETRTNNWTSDKLLAHRRWDGNACKHSSSPTSANVRIVWLPLFIMLDCTADRFSMASDMAAPALQTKHLRTYHLNNSNNLFDQKNRIRSDTSHQKNSVINKSEMGNTSYSWILRVRPLLQQSKNIHKAD